MSRPEAANENSTDANLLFGVIAMQSGLIDAQQFIDGCSLWSSRKGASLADVLVGQGWLVAEDRQHVEYLLRRKMSKEANAVRQSLALLPERVKSALSLIEDQAIHHSLQGLDDGSAEDYRYSIAAPVERRSRVAIKGLLSTGGIGQVWIAWDPVIGREIALKELKVEMSRSRRNRDRFFREAQLTGQLEHPGIVPVYEYIAEQEGARSYYTMRLVKGRTLTEAIKSHHKRRGGSETSELVRLLNVFVSVCQTIAYAHSRRVIHRDLKGDNIILGDFGEVIVLDWGLAKRLEEASEEPQDEVEIDAWKTLIPEDDAVSGTMQGEKLGTPAYMSPEQASGRIDEIDERTDVYGLAAILYEILTGHPPFLGTSIVEILHRVIHDPPPAPREERPNVSRELEQICLRGLSKARENRQQTALELAGQVEGWITERAERKRTDQERERFFNLSLDLLGIVDAEGHLQQTNPAWKSVLGWESSELNDRPIQDLLHPDEHERITRSLERILSGEGLTELERRVRCKDGSWKWVLWNASLIAGEAKVYIVGRDITERKQAEQTFRELLESAPDGMVVVNDQGRIVMVNAQLERIFGFTREELLGEPIEVLVPEEVRAGHPAKVARFLAHPSCRPMASGLKLSGRHKDGSVFQAEISLSPVRTEQGLLVSCAVRDVGARSVSENVHGGAALAPAEVR
jgi:PAS domain S-box-containing protein